MVETEIFKALADPTRRAVFEKLAGGGRNATELRAGLPISQPAMSQHLGVLREAGLIREARAGRTVTYTIDPKGLAPLQDWLLRYGAFWPGARRIERTRASACDVGSAGSPLTRMVKVTRNSPMPTAPCDIDLKPPGSGAASVSKK